MMTSFFEPSFSPQDNVMVCSSCSSSSVKSRKTDAHLGRNGSHLGTCNLLLDLAEPFRICYQRVRVVRHVHTEEARLVGDGVCHRKGGRCSRHEDRREEDGWRRARLNSVFDMRLAIQGGYTAPVYFPDSHGPSSWSTWTH